jgi:hypothetical protein
MPYNIHTIPRPRWIVTLVLVAVAAGIYGLSSSPGVEASGNPTNGAFTWFYRGAEMIEPSGTFFDVEAPAGSDYIVTADIPLDNYGDPAVDVRCEHVVRTGPAYDPWQPVEGTVEAQSATVSVPGMGTASYTGESINRTELHLTFPVIHRTDDHFPVAIRCKQVPSNGGPASDVAIVNARVTSMQFDSVTANAT